MSTVAVTDESFEKDVLQASGPVLVDFWAEWCGPCKQIAPALEQISDELGDGHLAGELFGELFQGGGDLLARAAPLGPEVHQNGGLGPQDIGLEGVVGDLHSAHSKTTMAHGKCPNAPLDPRM